MNGRAIRRAAVWGLVAACLAGPALAQRVVKFPPPDSKPPPPMKTPPRTQASGEDTGIIPDFGPTMRKTQERLPPPPTLLTVMFKVEYGEKLKYVYPDGTAQVFDQWKSFHDDGYKLMALVNERLADGNNYQYATKALASPGFDPLDIPMLYMTGDYEFTLRPEEAEHLRKFLLDGGTIVFNAARGMDDFSRSVAREMRKVFPHKNFMRLPADHPVFHSRFRIKQVMEMINGVQFMRPPEAYGIDIGTRAAAILVPGGLGTAWSGGAYFPAGRHIVGESGIRLGVNLAAYVLGGTEYGRFLAQSFPQYSGSSTRGDPFRFVQARYAGAWNVNPALQNSVLQGLRDNTDVDADFTPVYVDLDSPDLMHHPLVFMTGHYDFELTAAEVENLRGYFRKGGMMFASAAAGLKPFDLAVRREFKKVFPDADFIRLPPSHPLFSGGWNPVDRVTFTSAALRDDPSLEHPRFEAILVDGRLALVYTPDDVLSGLNRESNAYAKGLTPEDALRVAINVITHAMSH